MTNMIDNQNELFSEREIELQDILNQFNRRSFRMSTIRMVLFLSVAASFVAYFSIYHHFLLIIIGLIFTVAFIISVIYHMSIKNTLAYYRHLKDIHVEYQARTNHSFEVLKDDGNDFVHVDHDYSSDLDLFGSGSLFHLISTAETYFGRKKLKDLLLASMDPDLSSEQINERQEAVAELGEDPWKLQDFQAKGRLSCRHKKSPKAFLEYIAQKESTGSEIKRVHLISFAALTIIMLIALLIATFSGIYLYPVVFFILILQLSLTAIYYNRFKVVFESTEGLHRELYMYKALFEWIEETQVQSKLLTSMKCFVADREQTRGGKASKQLARLHGISLFIQARNQPLLFLFLNSLFLYDIYCVYFLRRWIRRSGSSLKDNLELLGQWEALGSLSMMHVIYPDCSFPVFREDIKSGEKIAYFSANEMGHPLIPTKRQVRSDLDLPDGIALITGSNMSGKTTLLRTVGVNAVLAYAGAVCCAKRVELGIMCIGSSMRIADNLEAGLSTFYAELLRIERIVKAARLKRPMLFLIDEIFRGTNSKDRTDGAQLVINNLLEPWVIGLMSTHDYQLCEVNKGRSGIRFYYFSEKYDEEGIHFDYRLTPGISTYANARYLMKMVGIE
ncbi:MAG: hypothetical protein JW780_00695 [Clostridiales bacterium]|nr:hypothetical protein [Clostridiales bacterium]